MRLHEILSREDVQEGRRFHRRDTLQVYFVEAGRVHEDFVRGSELLSEVTVDLITAGNHDRLTRKPQCADGGLAARASLQALALDYYATPPTWGVAQALERLLLAQNRWLQANGGGQPLLTTLSALVFRGQRFTLAHVGDCRVYRWLDGELQRISEDHVSVNERCTGGVTVMSYRP